jgi:SET domain-containing protein
MMMVRTELRPSAIHGIGVVVTEHVKAGQLIWRFDSRIDRVFSDPELQSLPDLMQEFLRTYSTLHADLRLWVLCGDNGRHFNHSDRPNTRSLGIAFGDDYRGRRPSGRHRIDQ